MFLKMINVYFSTQEKYDWIRDSPTGTNQVNNCKFFFDKNYLYANSIDYFVVFNQMNNYNRLLKKRFFMIFYNLVFFF